MIEEPEQKQEDVKKVEEDEDYYTFIKAHLKRLMKDN